MSQIIYYSDSIGKIVSVFAIECAIVFAFILMTIFCCLGKIFPSNKNKNKNKKNTFIFEKYSNKNKLNKEFIEILYLDEPIKENYKNNQQNNKVNNYEFFWKNLFGLNKDSKLKKLENINEQKENINEQKENINEQKENISNEENQENIEYLNNKIEHKEDDIENNIENNIHDNKEPNANNLLIENLISEKDKVDIEAGLIKKKIYLLYEFNNLDKISKPSSYIESEETDEFDELEEFIQMVIKSFENNYEQVGVLLKISSPGGSAFKFEHAYQNLLRLKEKKIELIGLVDKMAASGGYMLASACDKIVCSKYSIIGSVGVIAQLYNWSELNKKVGLEEKTWTTGSHKNPFPLGSNYTQEDNERMNEMIQETFEIFKGIVIKSRNFTTNQIEEILKAKTFPGFKALELNMVDEIMMSHDYIDLLEENHNVWYCYTEKNSKSLLNSLLFENLKTVGFGLVGYINKMVIDKKVDNIKLL
jgi:signal peptide peptidase SppA